MALYGYKRWINLNREKFINFDTNDSSENNESVPLEIADKDIKTQIYQMVRLWADILVFSYFKVERLRFKE
jgi:hypothetical protein